MKKKIIICLIVVILVTFIVGSILLLRGNDRENNNGDVNNNIVIDNNFLDYVYSQEITKEYQDIRNITRDDIDKYNVSVSENVEIYNEEVIEKFYDSYKNGQECFVRLKLYTTEGDPIYKDVLYDKSKIYVVVDYRWDKFGSTNQIKYKKFDKMGIEKYLNEYFWTVYNGENNIMDHDENWTLTNVSVDYLNKINKEDIVLEKMSIDKFYAINSWNGISDIRTLDKEYSLDMAKKDQCIIKGNNAFCSNTLDNFIKDFNKQKSTAIRIVTKVENGFIIKDVYYDNDFNKIYLVVDRSRVNNIQENNKKIKMLEYVRIREYSNSNKIDLIAADIRDDYYLCDCIWDDNEVFNLV